MVANLIFKSDHYYCSNCMMRQSGILPRCAFCGYEFSNWENIMYEKINKEIQNEIKEEDVKIE